MLDVRALRTPVIVAGAVGATLVTVGGWGSGAVAYGTGPAHVLGLPQLTYGHGAALMLAVTWVGIALVVCAWVTLAPRAITGRLPAREAITAAAAWNLPLLPSVPLFSRDAWSYLAQGAMANRGFDPFTGGPAVNPGPVTDQIADDWQITPTPYGPGHLLLVRLLALISGDRPEIGIVLLRVCVFAALAGLVWALLALARRTGTDPGLAVWITAASPLAVLHLSGGLHNEIFALLPAVVAVSCALRGRALTAALLIGLAVSIKVTAVLVAPFLVWMLLARDPRGVRPVTLLGSGIVLAACAGAVVALVSTVGGGFGWLGALSVSDRIINYLSLPTGAAHLVSAVTGAASFNEILAASRTVAVVVLAVALVVIWVLARGDATRTLRGIVCALMAFVLLNTVSWPWYYPWVAAFWAAARPRQGLTVAAVGVTVFLSGVLGPDGSTSLYTWPIMAGIVAATAAAVVFVRLRLRTPSPVPAA